jgi:SAM-dependent methyltransferase
LLLEIAHRTGGPIIDLACGTGRTTLPLAAAGLDVTGVDASESMLAHAREKARTLGLAVEFHLQDCTRLEMPFAAPLATMTGNAFQEFLTNDAQDQLLMSVARNLDAGGLFVFGTRLPCAANLDRPPGEQPWRSVSAPDGRTIVATVIWSYDPTTQLQDYVFIERIGAGDGALEEKRSRGRLRYTGPLELRRLLTANGFAIEGLHGSWAGAPLATDSREMVVVARKSP